MTFSLVVDLGASFLKAARVAADGALLGAPLLRQAPDAAPTDGPGSQIIDGAVLLSAVESLIADGCAGEQPEVIAISNQMHGFVVVDSTLAAHYGPVTWQDQRGSAAVALLEEELGSACLRRLGGELRTGIPLATLAALKGSGVVRSGDVIASIGDWVAWQLIGSRAPIHATNAAAMGFYNLTTRAWDPEAVVAAGLAVAQLPDVLHSESVIGRTRSGSRVIVPVGDQQAALLGIGLSSREISFNVATGAQVSRVSSGGLAPNVQTRPYFHESCLHTVTHIPAGRALNAWLGLVTEFGGQPRDLQTEWSAILARVREADGVSDLEFNLGIFDSADGQTGMVSGIHEADLSLGLFFRAALESVAKSLATHALRVGYDDVEGAVLSGGWMQSDRHIANCLMGQLPVPARLAVGGEDTLGGLGCLVAGLS